MLGLLRSAHELSKVVTLGLELSQSRTVSFLGRTLTLRQWRIEYEPDQQHCLPRLERFGIDRCSRVWRLLEPTTWVGPKASQISELRGTAKWHDPPEEVERRRSSHWRRIEAVPPAVKFNFLVVDRPDLLHSVKELVRKMASPRTPDLTALKRVARYTIKYPRVTCRCPWTRLDNNIEVFGDANFACVSARKSTCRSTWSKQRERGVGRVQKHAGRFK